MCLHIMMMKEDWRVTSAVMAMCGVIAAISIARTVQYVRTISYCAGRNEFRSKPGSHFRKSSLFPV